MFRFNVKKTREAICVLLHLQQQKYGPTNYLSCTHLFNMLYLADRTNIVEMEQPICGGRVVFTNNNAFLPDVYKELRGTYFKRRINIITSFNSTATDNLFVYSTAPLSTDNLCELSESILQHTYNNYPTAIHTLPEYIEGVQLEWLHLLTCLGIPTALISLIASDQQREQYLNDVLKNN
jgi:hypothetical protein